MEEQFQYLFNIAVTAFGGLLGWFLRVVWEADKEIRTDLRQVERDMKDNYVRRDDYNTTIRALFEKLDRIEDKIDRKADK
mgnify:CR=1 FL=1